MEHVIEDSYMIDELDNEGNEPYVNEPTVNEPAVNQSTVKEQPTQSLGLDKLCS